MVSVIFGVLFTLVAVFLYKKIATKKDKSARDARNAALPKAPDGTGGDPAAGPDGKH